MNDWKTVKLSDLGEIVGGATPSTKCEDYYNGDVAWLTPKDLAGYNNRFISRGERNITELGLKNCSSKLMPKHSILFTSRAPIGYIAIAENTICTNQGFKSVVPNKKNYFMFIYYLLKYNKERIEAMGSGTTFKEVSGSVMKSIEVTLPPLAEQKAIADTLSALDDKIELNNKMNKNLEEMAQAIFKSWFVDFEPFKDGEFVDSELGRIPKGWRVVELGDIADITMGQSPNGSSYNETNNGTVFFQGRAEFGWRFPTKRLCTTEPKRYAEQGDILMSVRAPVGDINIALEKCCIGRGLSSISAKNNARSFLLYAVKNLKSRLNMFNSEGTVFGSINKDCLNGLSVIIPTFDLINKFELLVRPMDNKIEKNSIELCFLTTLRDTLLPKLMSGEIRVPYKEYAEVK